MQQPAVPIYQVDAFTDRPFGGNPAAVCILDRPADPDWMQHVALEMNLSETAFVCPENGAYRLRWFTPATEVSLCGHATLATAHTLWSSGRVPPQARLEFNTLSGLLTVERQDDLLEMNFPADPPLAVEPPEGLYAALGIPQAKTFRGLTDLLVLIDSADALRTLDPDVRALGAIENVRGIIVTSLSDDPDHDFISRFFAPAAGVDEDPVTGSAHCLLGPFWAERLGRDELRAYQASARGGSLRLRIRGERIFIAGHAVTVAEGVLHV